MGQEETTSGQNRRRPGRPRIPGDIEAEIKSLALEGYTPPQIHEALERTPEFEGRMLPVVKTIKRIIERYFPKGLPSERWGLADADGDDAAMILPVLAAVIERTAGRVSHLTKAQAVWVQKIRRVAPDLAPWWAFRLAVTYMVRVHREQPTADLDELLAFVPWRSRAHLDHFLSVIKMIHPNWIHYTGHEPAENATPEEMCAALGSLSIAEGLVLAMEMQKGAK